MRSVFENNGFLVSGLFLSPYVNQSRGRTTWIAPARGTHPCQCHVLFPALHIPSGELSHSNGKSPFLMGKSTISMAIFNSYVKLPEGILHCVTRVSLNDSTRTLKYLIYFSKLGTHGPYGLSYCSPKSRISVVRGPHAVQQLFAVLGTIAAEVSKAKSESLLQTHFNWQCQAWVEQTPGMINKKCHCCRNPKNPMEFSVRAWHCVFLLRCCWLLNDHYKH